MIIVRTATAEDLEQAAASLAEAFDRDPMARWIEPEPATRVAGLRGLFEHRLRVAMEQGATVLVTDDLGAAAVWLPPGMSAEAGPPPEARSDVVEALAAMDAAHPIRPHWYLEWLGSREGGAGRGSALMSHMLPITDAAGMPTALWTGGEGNLDFYGRRGYAVLERIDFEGASGWWLWRDAG